MHWTISRLKDFETCPKRYEYKYLLATPEPGPKSPALARGIALHSSCEDFLLGKSQVLHREIGPAWQQALHNLKRIGAKPEVQWEFNAGWHPYLSSEPLWLRMKLDAHYLRPGRDDKLIGKVIDFKTGKPYTSNEEQNEVYALGMLAMFDHIDTVETELWYFDAEDSHEKVYERKQAPKLARKWEQRSDAMLQAKTYPAKPGRACSWCPFRTICPDRA